VQKPSISIDVLSNSGVNLWNSPSSADPRGSAHPIGPLGRPNGITDQHRRLRAIAGATWKWRGVTGLLGDAVVPLRWYNFAGKSAKQRFGKSRIDIKSEASASTGMTVRCVMVFHGVSWFFMANPKKFPGLRVAPTLCRFNVTPFGAAPEFCWNRWPLRRSMRPSGAGREIPERNGAFNGNIFQKNGGFSSAMRLIARGSVISPDFQVFRKGNT